MQSSSGKEDVKERRRELFRDVVNAFSVQYDWLGAQTSRELLLSAASQNLARHTDPPYRMRMHIMLAWKRGWLKSTMLKKMVEILGEENCGITGKVTAAAIRGSISAGKFSPPKVSKKPILISTEFGQTNFEEELLNTFLSLLEEGFTNVNLNKIGGISDTQKDKAEKDYEGVFFRDNEFDLQTDFVFWGGTYDPSTLDDSALKQRFKIVTPVKSVEKHGDKVVDSLIENNFNLSQSTVKGIRKELRSDEITETRFVPPKPIRKKHKLEPRELGDLQRYMACRNWWGLDVNPEVMDKYISHVKKSRKVADMTPRERIMDLIFDSPKTYQELMDETGLSKLEIYKILQDINASRHPGSADTRWVISSGDSSPNKQSLQDKETIF